MAYFVDGSGAPRTRKAPESAGAAGAFPGSAGAPPGILSFGVARSGGPSPLTAGVPALVFFAVVVLLLFVDLPLCGARIGLGVPCPGCGMTRAVRALLRGELATAWHFHPLVYPLFLVFGVETVRRVRAFFSGRPLQTDRLVGVPATYVLLGGAILLFVVWGFRIAQGTHPDAVDPAAGLVTRWFFTSP